MKITLSGRWAIDSQLLVYALDAGSRFHEKSRELFHIMFTDMVSISVAQQNVLEAEQVFVKVYKKDKLWAIEAVQGLIVDYGIAIVTPLPQTIDRYHELIVQNMTKNDLIDLYLAATLLDNSITQLLTANPKDFTGIKELTVNNPL